MSDADSLRDLERAVSGLKEAVDRCVASARKKGNGDKLERAARREAVGPKADHAARLLAPQTHGVGLGARVAGRKKSKRK